MTSKVGRRRVKVFNLREHDLVGSCVWSSPGGRDGALPSTITMRHRSLQSSSCIIQWLSGLS